MTGQGSTRSVAVIAVHGVADQKPGDTVRAVAQLLVASPLSAAAYRLQTSDAMALPVPPLAPAPPLRRKAQSTQAQQAPTPIGPRPLGKALAQSVRSDLHRGDWVAPPAAAQPSAAPATPAPGIELTDFLLFKAQRNETPTVAYDTTRLGLERSDGAASEHIELYEMYWADLSRLASGVPRIVTELFTLLFRLSQLGRDTVAMASRQFTAENASPRRWRWLSGAQTALDWGFSKVLALLTLQLLMAALIIVPAGLAAQAAGFAEQARDVLSVLLPALAFLWVLYRFEKTLATLVAAALALGTLFVLLAWPPAHWVVGAAWLGLLCLAYDAVMRLCDTRFPMTRFIGWCWWAAMLMLVLGSAGWFALAAPAGLPSEQGLRIWVFAALRGLEFVLAATVLWWGAAGAGLVVWLLAGQACSRSNGYEGGASVATGRLGLFVSMGLFVVLTMAAWAALTPLLGISVAGMQYMPLIFRDAASAVMPASDFLDARYDNSTEAFSLVVLLMLALALHPLVGFFPSLLAEMKLLTDQPARLGRWLTLAYRSLDILVALVVVLAALAAIVIGIALNSRWFGTAVLSELNTLFPQVARWSQDFLQPLIWTAASATVALTVLGGVLSRYVPYLRAPLDVALDVDGHFREFPRHGIPRARIFSRFAALLQHVAAQGHERIVIVAHSQGTVIASELLRYLKYRGERAQTEGDEAAALWRRLDGRVHLLTAGCPLRQLYAARFPTLYRWVLRDHPQFMGPTAEGIGVQRWINAYTTGDYIGRWLWSRHADALRDLSETVIDELERPGDVYAVTGPLPALPRQLDVCLGAGAHTHYFESDQHVVAALIDQLIASPWPHAQQATGDVEIKAA